MDQNKSKNILLVYFALNTVEAAFGAGYILSLPTDLKNQVLFGYSLPRSIVLVGFILVLLACSFAAYKICLNTAPTIRFLEKVFKHRSRVWMIFSLANGLLLAGLMFCVTRPSSVRDLEAFYAYIPLKPMIAFLKLEGYYERILPTVIWLMLVSIQTTLALLYLYAGQFKQAIQAEFARPRPRILIILTVLAALSILVVGLSRAVPFILEPDKDLALHLVQNDIVENIHRYLWILAIYFNLILAWILSWKLHGQTVSGLDYIRYFLPLLIALLFSYYCLTVIGTGIFWDIDKSSNWNVFYITSDSGGYVQKYSNNSIRPPVYPLFIQLLTAGTGFNHTLQGYQRTIKDIHHPLMKVVRAQKIVLLIFSLVACMALMGLMSSTLPAIFFLWLYEYGFFSPEISQIMSEAIAQAWLFLILASFFAFLWKRWKFLLPLSGFFCAGLYLTRPAGVYGGVLLVAMFLWALYHEWRSYWLPCLIAVLLTAALIASPILYTYFTVGNLYPTPMYALAKIAFALQVAEPEDINLMPDEQAHRFLIKALEIKRVEDAKIEAVVPRGQGRRPYFTQVTANLYIVSALAINDVLPEGSPTDNMNLLARVSTPLLAHHRFEYYKLALNSFWYATTRLSIYSFWGIITICLVLALLLRGWAGFSAIALIFTHLTHLWIVSLFDIPIMRYIWATQFLILLSLFIMLWSIINTWARNKSWSKQEINQ